MSDFAQTVSCDRLPQRIAARIERSCLTCSIKRVERGGELLLNGFGAHAGTLAAFMECNRMASWPCSPVTKTFTGGGEDGIFWLSTLVRGCSHVA